MVEAPSALPHALYADERFLAEHDRALLPGFDDANRSTRRLRSVAALIAAIEDHIRVHNSDPKPFIWTAKASDILEKVTRAQAKLQKLQSA